MKIPGHGSKMVEESAEDKKLDTAKGITEGSPQDRLADRKIGKRLFSKRGPTKTYGGKRY